MNLKTLAAASVITFSSATIGPTALPASAAPAPEVTHATTQAADPGQFAVDNLVASNVYIWNHWTSSVEAGTGASATAGKKLQGAAWSFGVTTYNNSYPGTLQVQICSVSPDRCYNITSYPDSWTDAFNDLDAATTKFYFKYRWYSSAHPDGGTRYDALIGTGIKPYVTASVGAWWASATTPDAAARVRQVK